MNDNIVPQLTTKKIFRSVSGELWTLEHEQIEKIPYLTGLVSSAESFASMHEEFGETNIHSSTEKQRYPTDPTFEEIDAVFFNHQLDSIQLVITSFSTPFYVLEKNWFIRCDMSPHYLATNMYNRHGQLVVLYTIPIPFEIFTISKTSSEISFSNWPKNNPDYRSRNMCENIKTLVCKSCRAPDQSFNQNWVHVLTKLRHLTIEEYAVLSMENFNILLDQTPYLCSLAAKKSMMKLLTDNWTGICVCKHLSQKIRSLTFHSPKNSSQCFDTNELKKTLPIFSSKCQHLSLGVRSRKNHAIDFILRKMPQMNSLHVHIQQYNSPPPTIEWLEQQHTRLNHSNCIIINEKYNHYFWLG